MEHLQGIEIKGRRIRKLQATTNMSAVYLTLAYRSGNITGPRKIEERPRRPKPGQR